MNHNNLDPNYLARIAQRVAQERMQEKTLDEKARAEAERIEQEEQAKTRSDKPTPAPEVTTPVVQQPTTPTTTSSPYPIFSKYFGRYSIISKEEKGNIPDYFEKYKISERYILDENDSKIKEIYSKKLGEEK